jgi:hypothetical protein
MEKRSPQASGQTPTLFSQSRLPTTACVSLEPGNQLVPLLPASVSLSIPQDGAF